MLLFLILSSIFLFLLYKYFDKKYRFWKERGIPSAPVVWPLGCLFYRIMSTAIDYEVKTQQKYGRIYGSYNGIEPVLVLTDYELVKQILIKDFQHFNSRVNFRTYHKMWNENLVFAGFNRWKRIRTIASPAFTTGKLRAMNPLMQKCVNKLIVFLDKVCQSADSGIFKTKEVLGGFTMDVISSAAFGTETDVNDMREKPNKIFINAQKIFIIQIFKSVLAVTMPKWFLKMMGIEHFLNKDAFNFFINFTRHIVKERKQKLSFRNDFIQYLLDAEVDEEELNKNDLSSLIASEETVEKVSLLKKINSKINSTNLRLTEDEIIAQSIVFLTAGYETTATTITHTIHEISINQNIQNKLYEELLNVLYGLDECSNEYYDKIMRKTPYLEATIKETLRKYPPLSRLNRICNTEGYQLGNLKLNAGQEVAIMAVAIHRDPQYFPNPEKFDPERFLSLNTKDIPFVPWGNGPRNCIGMRFSLQEMKACLSKLVLRYRFEKPENNYEKELKYRVATPFLSCYDFPTKISMRHTPSIEQN